MFHGWEQFHGVESLLLKVLGDIPCQLPDTFEHKLGDLELLGVRSGSTGRERLDNLKQKIEERPEAGFRMASVCDPEELPEHRHPTSCGEQTQDNHIDKP